MISERAQVHPTAQVWNGAHVREQAVIGERVIIGVGAYVGVGVSIGSDSKVQNNALLYEPCNLEQGVFIGPGAILTNDRVPRAVNPDMSQKGAADWSPVGVVVKYGASIGAGAICIAPVTVGAWSMVAAGAVVARDVPDFALVMGCPARQVGWVGRTGSRLVASVGDDEGFWCPDTGEKFSKVKGKLVCTSPNPGRLTDTQ